MSSELRGETVFCPSPLPSNAYRGPKGIDQDSPRIQVYFGLTTALDAQGINSLRVGYLWVINLLEPHIPCLYNKYINDFQKQS